MFLDDFKGMSSIVLVGWDEEVVENDNGSVLRGCILAAACARCRSRRVMRSQRRGDRRLVPAEMHAKEQCNDNSAAPYALLWVPERVCSLELSETSGRPRSWIHGEPRSLATWATTRTGPRGELGLRKDRKTGRRRRGAGRTDTLGDPTWKRMATVCDFFVLHLVLRLRKIGYYGRAGA